MFTGKCLKESYALSIHNYWSCCLLERICLCSASYMVQTVAMTFAYFINHCKLLTANNWLFLFLLNIAGWLSILIRCTNMIDTVSTADDAEHKHARRFFVAKFMYTTWKGFENRVESIFGWCNLVNTWASNCLHMNQRWILLYFYISND